MFAFPHSYRRFRVLSIWAFITLFAVSMSPVQARQQSSEMMVMDDGNGAQVMHFTMPDFQRLRTPDYILPDLPIFERSLHLSEAQLKRVDSMLDAYLVSFKALLKTHFPRLMPLGTENKESNGADPSFVRGGGNEGQVNDFKFEEGESGIGATIQEALGDAVMVEGIDLDLEAGAFPGGEGEMRVAMVIDVGDDEGGGNIEGGGDFVVGGDGEMPPPGVFISIGDEEGMELSDEDRAKMEEMAQKIAERIKKKMAEREANGEVGMEFTPESMEERKLKYEAMAKQAEVFETARKTLGEEFTDQVKSLLAEEQLTRWPKFDQAITRKKTLPLGRMDGERTDLVSVLESLDIDTSQTGQLHEQVESYGETLHAALTHRNAFLRDSQTRVDKALGEGKTEKALAIVDWITRLRLAVRRVNIQYTEAMAGEMSADEGAAFRDAVLRRSFPRVYRTTRGEKAFAAARNLEGLDASLLVSIDALYDLYQMELESMNERIKGAILKHEPSEARRMIEHFQEMQAGHGEMMDLPGMRDDPIRVALRSRRDLDERWMKQLYELFTPDQVKQLPTLPSQVNRQPIIIENWSGGGGAPQ